MVEQETASVIFISATKSSYRPGLRRGDDLVAERTTKAELTNFEDVVRLDLAYIEHWSLWLDFKILVKTIPAVFKARGAC